MSEPADEENQNNFGISIYIIDYFFREILRENFCYLREICCLNNKKKERLERGGKLFFKY